MSIRGHPRNVALCSSRCIAVCVNVRAVLKGFTSDVVIPDGM